MTKKTFCLSLLLLAVFVLALPVAAQTRPTITIPTEVPGAADTSVGIPITFDSGGNAIRNIVFSIDYDESLFTFNDFDCDLSVGGMPIPCGASFDTTDTDSEIDVTIGRTSPPFESIPDGELITIILDIDASATLDSVIPLDFSTDPAPSFGNDLEQSVDGDSINGSVRIVDSVPNVPPVAMFDVVRIPAGTVATSIDVLANDLDPDVGPSALSISGVTPGTNGTTPINVVTSVTYLPNGFVGLDTFEYTITDGEDTDTATAYAGNGIDVFAIAIGDSISPDSPEMGMGRTEAPGDEDIYIFQGEVGQNVIFTGFGASTNFVWTLNAPDGSQVFSQNFTDIQVELPQSGLYTLTFAGQLASSFGTYNFELVEVAPPQTFAIAIGDTVPDDVTEVGAGDIEAPGAVDVYTFEGVADQTIIFDRLSGVSTVLTTLEAPDGTELFSQSINDVQAILPQDGTYTLTVEGLFVSSFGPYSFQLLEVGAAEAFTIAIGDTVPDDVTEVGAGELEAPGAVDVYTFEGVANQVILFDQLSGSNSFSLTLEAPDGTELFSQIINDVEVTLPQDGTYTLTVEGLFVSSFGPYSFVLLNVPIVDGPFTIAIGDTVPDDVTEAGAGELEAPGAVDVYTFEGVANQVILFDQLSGSNSFSLTLEAPDGTELFSQIINDVEVTLPQDGTYTLTVEGLFVSSFGPYSFQPVEVILNSPPVAVDDSYETDEDTTLAVDAASGVLNNDTDDDGDTLTVTLDSDVSDGTLTLNADGSFTYIPNTDFNGSDTFTYIANDGSEDSAPATVTITVNPINDNPIAIDDGAVTNEDTAVTFDPTANDIDVDGDELTVTGIFTPRNGDAVINLDSTVTYTPDANFSGNDSFDYIVSDGNGGSDQVAIVVVVNPVNDDPVAVDDNATTDEDVAVDIDVLTNDSDVEGDTLSVDSATDPDNGSVVVNPDDTITYTPDADFNGSDTFDYTVTDGNGGSDTATVTITINPINDDPVAVDDEATTVEDVAVIIDILANDSDVDGDTLSVDSATDPDNGSVEVNLDNTITYTPDADFNGSDTFDYTVSDGNGGSETATVTITVNPINDDPVAVDDEATTDEDVAVDIDVLTNDTDVDGDTLSVDSATDPANGSVEVNLDNTITYTPDADYNGSDTFDYTITDGNGGSDTATVTITINPVNDDPALTLSTDDLPVDEGVGASRSFTVSDVDGDSVTVNANEGTITDLGGGSYQWDDTPDDGPATLSVEITIDDGNGGTAAASFDVVVANVAPTATFTNTSGPLTAGESAQLVFTDQADPSTADTSAGFLYSYDCTNDGTFELIMSSSPTFNCPYPTPGTFTARGRIEDKDGGFTDLLVAVDVNDAPNDDPVASDDEATTDEDVVVIIDVLANDTDTDGDMLSVDSATDPANGSVAVNPDATITYTPDANFNGVDSFNYTVGDGNGGSDTATVTITVNPVNDDPVATDDTATTDEAVAVNIDVLANDSDVDGDTLSVDSATDPANGSVVVNPDNSITYTPDAGFTGTDSFEYTITDGNGGSDTATVSVTVRASGPGDVVTIMRQIDRSSDDVNEDGPSFVTLSPYDWIGNGRSVDSDYLGLRFNGISIPQGATIEEAYMEIYSHWFMWNRIAFQTGAEAVANSPTFSAGNRPSQRTVTTVQIEDVSDVPWSANTWQRFDDIAPVIQEVVDQGAWQSGNSLSLIVQGIGNQWGRKFFTSFDGNPTFAPRLVIRFSSSGSNLPPFAVDDLAMTPEDAAVVIAVLANDGDADGDALTVTSTSVPANGVVNINADNAVTYTPNANFNGPDMFEYTISDGNGGSATTTVQIMVTPVNDAPVATDDSAMTTVGSPVTVMVLANDTDVDGDSLSVTAATNPANGTAGINPDGTITYAPNAGFTGTDSFEYTITDGIATSTATVTIRVAPLAGDTLTFQVNQSSDDANERGVHFELVSPFAWVGNTDMVDHDYLGLRFNGVNIPAGANIEEAYIEVYSPFNQWLTLDVQFGVEDADNSATFADSDRPSQRPVMATQVEDRTNVPWSANSWNRFNNIAPVVQQVVDRAGWQSGNSLSLIAQGIGHPWGRKFISSFDNDPALAPRLVVRYTMDGVTARLAVINVPPRAGDDQAMTESGVPVTIAVLTNDSDPEGATLVVTEITGATADTVMLNHDQSITYTPPADFAGNEVFTYTISDGHGGQAQATVTIQVTKPDMVDPETPVAEITKEPVPDAEVTEEPTSEITEEPVPEPEVTEEPTAEVIDEPTPEATEELPFVEPEPQQPIATVEEPTATPEPTQEPDPEATEVVAPDDAANTD